MERWHTVSVCPAVEQERRCSGSSPRSLHLPSFGGGERGVPGSQSEVHQVQQLGEALDVCSVTGSPFAFEEIFLIL